MGVHGIQGRQESDGAAGRPDAEGANEKDAVIARAQPALLWCSTRMLNGAGPLVQGEKRRKAWFLEEGDGYLIM